jgi:hypothetical protein
LNHYRKLINFT